MITTLTGLVRKIPSPLYKVLAQNYIDLKFPRHIFIETTSACNLACEYCPREKRNDHMDFSLFKAIVDEASNYGRRSFSLHLFGEPLLYPKILEAIRYIKDKNKHHTVLLTTNGTLLNKFAERLETSGVNRIIWSYRKNNFNEESIRLLKKRGLIRLLIEETPKDEFDRWSKFPRVEVKHLHNYGGNIDVSRWSGGISNGSEVQSEQEERWPCYHLWLAPAIRWNGEIVECCNVPKSGEYVLGRYGLDSTIYSVWNGSSIASLRENHLNGIYPGACAGCNSWQAYPNIFFRSQCQAA